MKNGWKQLLISEGISLGVGILASLLTRSSMQIYEDFSKPPLAPPGIVFPVVWTVLYLLMGYSAFRIVRSDSEERHTALRIYALQLLLNFSWSIIFFNMRRFLAAFLVLIALWIVILLMISKFNRIDKLAAALQIPYFFWVTFAAYLNLAVWYVNLP